MGNLYNLETSKVKSKYWKRTCQFGIQLPKTVDEALRFDKEDIMDIWQKAVKKEMKNVWEVFEFNEQDSSGAHRDKDTLGV